MPNVTHELNLSKKQQTSQPVAHILHVEIQAQHRPDRLKKPRTESVGTDRLGRVPSRLGPIG